MSFGRLVGQSVGQLVGRVMHSFDDSHVAPIGLHDLVSFRNGISASLRRALASKPFEIQS